MQSAKCKMQNKIIFSFCILHFALCISLRFFTRFESINLLTFSLVSASKRETLVLIKEKNYAEEIHCFFTRGFCAGRRGSGAIGQKNSADANADARRRRGRIHLFGIRALKNAPDLSAQ